MKIIIEGVNGEGKTFLMNLIAKSLEGYGYAVNLKDGETPEFLVQKIYRNIKTTPINNLKNYIIPLIINIETKNIKLSTLKENITYLKDYMDKEINTQE